MAGWNARRFVGAAERAYVPEMRERVAARLPLAVAFLLGNAALATMFEVLRFPERLPWMASFDAAIVLISGAVLVVARLRRDLVIAACVVAVNAIGLGLNGYHAVVEAQVGFSVWVLAALLASVVVLLPWGWRAQALASMGTLLGYPLLLHARDTQPLMWAAGCAYLLVAAGTCVAGAALIGRYMASDLSLTKALSEREACLEDLLEREQQARRTAEAASRAKDEFLATLSHELRTPLTPLLGWSRQLQEAGLNGAEREQAIHAIQRSVRSLVQLIDDLLDVSRITQGKLSLKLQPADVATVVAGAIEPVRPAADAKGIRIETSVADHRAIVLADPDRLQQIVWNLVSNAIKFTDRSGVVRVEVRRVGLHAEILVADTGRGIDPTILPHVFDRFWQADGSITRSYGGLGLGLAIVRHLTELHGGTVHAESRGEGRGMTFRVRIPLAAEAVIEEEPAAPSAGVSLDGVSVLVVDDEHESREMLRTLLTHSGVEVQTADSVRQALEVLDRWHPRVLVSDLAMPLQDGYVLIRSIRAREAGSGGHLRALAFTARTRPEDRTEALAAGYDDYLPKPTEPDALLSIVAHLAQRDGHGVAG